MTSNEANTSLITGITGQDGSYLAEHLLRLGHEVHGVVRPHTQDRTPHLTPFIKDLNLHQGDLTDQATIETIIRKVQPDHVYNLAAQSQVGTSFQRPAWTWKVNLQGTIHVLEAVRQHARDARVYQASTSEMFGNTTPQGAKLSIDDEFNPTSPYAHAKLAAHHAADLYRDAYDLHVSCGILMNHESERRAPSFVTRKITKHLAEIAYGEREEIRLGNLSAVRDWGYAPEYVTAMHAMLVLDDPVDVVICTGEGASVDDFLDHCLDKADLTRDVVTIDPEFYRPVDVETLVGDPTQAKEVLAWEAKHHWHDVADKMLAHDLEQVQQEARFQDLQAGA